MKGTVQTVLVTSLWLLAYGCDKGEPTSEGVEGPTISSPEVESVPAPCEFVRATRSLVTVSVETVGSECAVVLPASPAPGELPVAIAVAGRDDVASVQIQAPNGAYYYANEGSVTIEETENGRIRGRFLVQDANPPETGGPFTAEFDVPFE